MILKRDLRRQARHAINVGICLSNQQADVACIEVQDLWAAMEALENLPGIAWRMGAITRGGQTTIRAWGENRLGQWRLEIVEGRRFWIDTDGGKLQRVKISVGKDDTISGWLKTDLHGQAILVDNDGTVCVLSDAKWLSVPVTTAPAWLSAA